MENKWYAKGVKYKHKGMGYVAIYAGRGYRNKHTYEVIEKGDSRFTVGDKFTPNDPEKYFDIIN